MQWWKKAELPLRFRSVYQGLDPLFPNDGNVVYNRVTTWRDHAKQRMTKVLNKQENWNIASARGYVNTSRGIPNWAGIWVVKASNALVIYGAKAHSHLGFPQRTPSNPTAPPDRRPNWHLPGVWHDFWCLDFYSLSVAPCYSIICLSHVSQIGWAQKRWKRKQIAVSTCYQKFWTMSPVGTKIRMIHVRVVRFVALVCIGSVSWTALSCSQPVPPHGECDLQWNRPLHPSRRRWTPQVMLIATMHWSNLDHFLGRNQPRNGWTNKGFQPMGASWGLGLKPRIRTMHLWIVITVNHSYHSYTSIIFDLYFV